MENNFGNFVVQKVLKLSQNENLFKIVSLIKSNIKNLSKRKLVNKWKLIISPYEKCYQDQNFVDLNNGSFGFVFNENQDNILRNLKNEI